MKRIIFLITIIAFVVTSCQKQKDISNVFSLEVYTDSIFQASIDSAQIAGAGILVYQKGEMLLNKLYGKASLELSVPMPKDAIFELASLTKQFTAAAILKLVEAKKLSLDDDFTDYLEFDTRGRTITINNLLNHTSGIPGYTEIDEFWEFERNYFPRDTLVRFLEQKDFLFEPNEASIYNNSAYFFLGLIIEKVTGLAYEAFLKQEFFTPLGMDNTSLTSDSKVVSNKVNGYDYSQEGFDKKYTIADTWTYSAGGLSSTTEDLLIWMRALHERKILTEPLYQSLITPDQLNDGTLLNYAKGLSHYSYYGYDEISHAGSFTGFSTYMSYLPDEDLYFICLINTDGPKKGYSFVNDIMWKLLKKQEYQGIDLDIDVNSLQGVYTGPAWGYTLSLEVKSIPNGITVQTIGRDKIDTLKVYHGNNIWSMPGNNKIIIENGVCRMFKNYGCYVLKKENN